ncbi:tetratricopeptide repeat protein, partial [bacterium]|nr:tetratricopeptide repeat protein [bacterium]
MMTGRRLLLAALLACAPAAHADDSGVEALRYARSRYEAGSYAEAAEAARAVLEDEPRNLGALDVLARALGAVGEEETAEKELRRVLAQTPSATAAALVLAESLTERGALDKTIPLFEQAKAEPALAIRAGAGLARVLLEADRRDDAARELKTVFAAYQQAADESLGADDLRSLAHAALLAERIPALAQEHVRSFAIDARDFFQRSFRRDKEQTDLLVEWAQIYEEKWDLVEARRLAREALKRNPRHARAHALLAETLLLDPFGGTAKYDQARDAIAAALAVNPRFAEAQVLSAELLVTDALYDDAISALKLALESRPLDVRALAEWAGILRV